MSDDGSAPSEPAPTSPPLTAGDLHDQAPAEDGIPAPLARAEPDPERAAAPEGDPRPAGNATDIPLEEALVEAVHTQGEPADAASDRIPVHRLLLRIVALGGAAGALISAYIMTVFLIRSPGSPRALELLGTALLFALLGAIGVGLLVAAQELTRRLRLVLRLLALAFIAPTALTLGTAAVVWFVTLPQGAEAAWAELVRVLGRFLGHEAWWQACAVLVPMLLILGAAGVGERHRPGERHPGPVVQSLMAAAGGGASFLLLAATANHLGNEAWMLLVVLVGIPIAATWGVRLGERLERALLGRARRWLDER